MTLIITIGTNKKAYTFAFGKPKNVFASAVGCAATCILHSKKEFKMSTEAAVNLMHVLVGEEVKRRIENVNN